MRPASLSSLGVSLLLLAALAGCAPEAAAPVQAKPAAPETQSGVSGEAKDSLVIVMLGDSLTAGFGLPESEALPAELERRLADQGVKATLINAGVSGDTSANGLARYDWSVGAADADILILALGANDFLQGVAPDTLRANLSSILARAEDQELSVVMAGLDPRETNPEQSINGAYSAVYDELSAEFDAPLYDDLLAGVWDQPDLLQADGLHPTAAGIDLVAEQLAGFLIDNNVVSKAP